MSTQARPPHMPWLSPYLTVKDADAALDFYQRAFGFVKHDTVPGPDGKTSHAEMKYNDAFIMFAPEGAFGSTTQSPATSGTQSPVTLYLYCEDVDALCARAQSAGATVATPPQDMFWGDRMCSLIDPSGHRWNFATYTGKTAPRPGE